MSEVVKTKEIEVKKSNREIPDIESEAQKFLDSIYELFGRLNSYSTWGTNVSLGLLGFYLAVLLQYQSAGGIPHKIYSFVVLFILGFCLIIGFIIFVTFEVKDIVKKLLKLVRDGIKIIVQAARYHEHKKEDVDSLEDAGKKLYELEGLFYTPNKLIIFQYALVVICIGMITFDLVRYLFFS